MMEWLNANSGALTVIATFVLVFVTGWYVLLTRRTLKASYKPEVIVRLLRGNLHFHNEHFADYEIVLCVKNVGPGVAYKIEFGDKDSLSFAPHGGEPLESVNFLKYGIDCLPPGDERRHNEPIIPDPSGDLNQLQVTVNVSYQDSQGTEYSYPFRLNFAESDLPPAQGYSQ